MGCRIRTINSDFYNRLVSYSYHRVHLANSTRMGSSCCGLLDYIRLNLIQVNSMFLGHTYFVWFCKCTNSGNIFSVSDDKM